MNQLVQLIKSGLTFTPAVVGYPVRGRRVLLGLRKQTSWGLGQNLISGIGGKVGDQLMYADETPEAALIREFREEVVISLKEFHHFGQVRYIFPNKPKWNLHVFIYLINSWTGEPQETEPTKPQWFEIDNLPWHNMWHDNQLWLPQILSNKPIDRTYLYDDTNTKVIESHIDI